ncbi:tyrosine-type recombinase/integrase [Glutamicibacter arilaitensis]|uniref:tyrosine-type recombinase/integrase n=1 Tax=Glutamicibacter arilaitensis TaxID=256701 RepID=UPI003FD5E053
MKIELPRDRDGKRRRKVVRRKSKSDAIQVLRELKAELAKTGDLATSSVTLETWSEHWLAERAKKLAPNTVNGYRVAFRDYINPMLGKRKLDKLTPQDIKHLHDVIQETPKDKALRSLSDPPEGTELLSSTYALLVHNALSGSLKMAVREGKLSRNVCELVDKPSKRHTTEEVLTLEEAIKLIGYLTTHPDGALWTTYLLTGARRGEIIGLEVDRVMEDHLDLSWQTQRITDRESAPKDHEYRHIGKSLYLARPKSKAGWRTPPLVPELAELLRREIGNRTEGLVFLRDGEPWDPADASKEWKVILAGAGVNEKVKLHGARHTAVGLLYELGVSEATIMQIVGHSTVSVTRRYGQAGNKRAMQDAIAKLSTALSGKAIES